MIPARFSHIAYSLFLSGIMTFIVTGVATVRAVGMTSDVFHLWLTAWPLSWLISFPSVTIVSPLARRLSEIVAPRKGD